MGASSPKREGFIRRRVIFDGRCNLCGWTGPERDAQWLAAGDLAGHRVDRHPRVAVDEPDRDSRGRFANG